MGLNCCVVLRRGDVKMCQLYLLSGIWVCDAQECGRAPIIDGRSGIEDRIVGGTDAVQGAWPWQVDIQVSPSGSDSIPS